MNPIKERIGREMEILRKSGYYPWVATLESAPQEPVVIIDGQSYINFASNNYLGIANHPKIAQAIRGAVEDWGFGSGSSRLVAGTTTLHLEVESMIAEFKLEQAAILFSTGTQTNMGVIPAIADSMLQPLIARLSRRKGRIYQEVAIFYDKLNHASLIEGIELCHVKGGKFPYNHCDMEQLEQFLKKSPAPHKMIVTDGIFSMLGDIAPLVKIVELAQQFNALVVVDDAHAIGVLGTNGRGSVELCGVEGDKHLLVIGTFSKAFGGQGGFVASDLDLVDYLRVASRTYMFHTALSLPDVIGLKAAIEVINSEPWRRRKLLENAAYLRCGLESLGYNTMGSLSHIIPVLIGDEFAAADLYQKLFKLGIFAPCFKFPAVKRGQAILRLNVMTSHEKSHLDQLLNSLSDLRSMVKG